MSAPPLPLTEKLTTLLRTLCAQPSTAGQIDDLVASAQLLATTLSRIGMQVDLVSTPGAPVLIARRAGRSPRTLLLYHRYDCAPPGPWRAWSHEPFQLAERDGALYGRGVAEGKGPLAAHIQALQSLIETEGGLPCNVVLIAEGDGLSGSPHLATALSDPLHADLCLGSAGGRDVAGTPFCYSGSKGLLRVRLDASGSGSPLPPGLASSMRNPLWRLIWALANIKGDDEDIRIPGFYEGVEGPSRAENARLRQVALDEAGRLAAWGAPDFLFGMSGASLVRAEVTLPTCNISAISCEPAVELPLLPSSASALLDFQLVPRQEPAAVLVMLRDHLAERGFGDIGITPLPGGYPPAHSPSDAPTLAAVPAAGAAVYGATPQMLPSGPFVLPLQILAKAGAATVATVGLARPDSSTIGPDEHIPAADLARHAQWLIELLCRMGAG